MTNQTHRLDLADGRTLRVFESGAVDGPIVVFLHGTPGCGRMRDTVIADAGERGLRLLSYDRPGYGESSRLPGRVVAHAAEDVAAIVDHFGAERFAVMGASGGGPHALACAALLGDRIVGCATLAGSAPMDGEGLDWTDGMGELNADEIEIARQGFDVLHAHLREQADNELLGTPEEMREGMASLLAPVDREALTDELAEYLTAHFREAVEHGVDGWTDESLSDYQPWGFELEEISAPVQLWHGEQDRFVPVGHGRWLAAHIPGVDARILPDQGHISLITGRTPDAHAWLAERLAA